MALSIFTLLYNRHCNLPAEPCHLNISPLSPLPLEPTGLLSFSVILTVLSFHICFSYVVNFPWKREEHSGTRGDAREDSPRIAEVPFLTLCSCVQSARCCRGKWTHDISSSRTGLRMCAQGVFADGLMSL